MLGSYTQIERQYMVHPAFVGGDTLEQAIQAELAHHDLYCRCGMSKAQYEALRRAGFESYQIIMRRCVIFAPQAVILCRLCVNDPCLLLK